MTDWDRRYRQGEYASEPPHPLVVTFASKFPAPGRVLDVACGMGRHALWLAKRNWHVTAVDNSRAGLEILVKHAHDKGLRIRTIVADLEAHEFTIESAEYDLIVVCNYLQRDLFGAIRDGVRPGGMAIAVIAMADDDPKVKPMNPAFLLHPGELRAQFKGWELLYDIEGKPEANPHARKTAQVVALKQ
jgi:SAM-dependent methyltransferase